MVRFSLVVRINVKVQIHMGGVTALLINTEIPPICLISLEPIRVFLERTGKKHI